MILLLQIDLDNASLIPGSFVEVDIPYDPSVIKDSDGNSVDPMDQTAQLKAFKEGWVMINHFTDEFAWYNCLGSVVPPEHILKTYNNENGIHYVRFRLFSFSVLSVGMQGATTSSNVGGGSGGGGGGCFIDNLEY